MTKPKPIKSHNPKDVEFYIRGWNEGQQELERAVVKWIEKNLDLQDTEVDALLAQSLLSAMEHS
jgi:hypothetical protein